MIGYKQPKMNLKDSLKDTLMKFRNKKTKQKSMLATGLKMKFNSGMMHK